MEYCLLKYFILNNELKNACDFNPSLLTAGPGIYEVFRVIDGKPVFLDEHLQRFFESAKHENTHISFDIKELKNRLKLLIEYNKMKFGNIRFQYVLHPTIGNIFLAWPTAYDYPSNEQLKKGVEIISIHAMRENPQSKRTNLPVRELAEELIHNQSIAEVLLVNDDGLITEGSRSNIFFMLDNKMYTSSASLVLPGITRDKIIKLALQCNIDVIEEDIPLKTIDKYDSCFLSSTSKSVLPIHKIDSINFKLDNPQTKMISNLYNSLMASYLKDFQW